jgi:hypothetical protein
MSLDIDMLTDIPNHHELDKELCEIHRFICILAS